MWPNNAFHGPGNFQHSQGGFRQNFSEDGYISFSPTTSNQQYSQQGHSQAMQYENDFMPGEYQPEVGLYNEAALLQNQFVGSDSPVPEQASQQAPMTTQGISRPALDAKAQKLKALVKMSQEQRAKSGTPPGPGSRQLRTSEGTSSLRESPISQGGPSDGPPDGDVKDSSTNEAVEALLSEVKAGANASVNKDRAHNNSSLLKLQQSRTPETGKISQTPLRVVPIKAGPQDGTSGNSTAARKMANKIQSNGDSSDASEGEIREDKLRLPKQTTGTKDVQTLTKPKKKDEQVLNKKYDEQNGKGFRASEAGGATRGQSPSLNTLASFSRNRGDRHEEVEEQTERKSYHSSQYERIHEPEPEQKLHRDHRDNNEVNRIHETKYERGESPRNLEVPTLAQLLDTDEDLRDWLNYTGYHKTEYRNKVLNRRRAIAALDAQKAKLLEEMELEERGGLQTANTNQAATTNMLPPPIPTKISVVSVPTKKTDSIPDRGKNDQAPTASNQDTGAKRTYNEYRGSQDKGSSEKMGRLDEQGRGVRIKSESQVDDRRSYSSGGYESSRHRSPSADSKTYRHEDRDKSVEEHGRGRGQNHSQEREISPGLKAYESRPHPRSKSYEFLEAEERHDRDDRISGRQFIQVGNYRGRAYDPNYKYRGRGRASWAASYEPEPRLQSGHANHRIASMKPYRDPRPLDRGGRGATRYFIVKSFNEENVIKSIEDGIWTTQIQNGDLFKTAFLTCKDVILIYSINHSRAFQGYARMEGVPGSEEAPRWMNNINWESAGAFRVRWITVAPTRFSRISHLKNKLNENQPVLVAKDGQEVEEGCGEELTRLIDEEAQLNPTNHYGEPGRTPWD